MEYQVPQFVEVEDKIFGPFTLKQFIYLAGGAGICAIILLNLPLFVGIILALPVAGFAAALAFYKMNGKPFIDILEAGFMYYVGNRLYLWKKDKQPIVDTSVTETQAPTLPEKPKKLGLTSEKLRDLAWSLDIKDQQR